MSNSVQGSHSLALWIAGPELGRETIPFIIASNNIKCHGITIQTSENFYDWKLQVLEERNKKSEDRESSLIMYWWDINIIKKPSYQEQSTYSV